MANDSSGEILVYIVMFLVGCVVAGYAMCGATEPSRIVEAAENAGLSDVVVGALSPFACSDSDDGGRYITATRQDGQRVEAVVCCGLYKRCTVRW